MRSRAIGTGKHTLELVAIVTTSRVSKCTVCAAEEPCVIRQLVDVWAAA